MKRLKLFKIFALIVFVLPLAFLLSACGDNDLKTFTDVVFANQTVDYDGGEHEIIIAGELPDGVSIVYENNKGTNAGVYNAKATISMEGYKQLVLTAKLTINKLNYDMSGAQWNYENAYTYNGNEQSVAVVNLPQGVTVKQYQNNTKTNAGNYTASVEFNYDTVNHNQPTLANLNWTINKASYDMSNVQWNYNNPFVYDGNEKEILIVGLPQGVTVSQYQNNKKIEAGTYTASAVLNYDTTNYNAISIDDCVWRIIPDVSQIALNVLNSLMKVPDPWEFLPESFALENKAYNGNTEIDFANFVNVSSLPQVAMGKQMNVVYSTLLDIDTALSYLRYVYGSFNIIVNFYQDFINSNQDNYSSYEKTTDNFTFKIVLDESDYQMYISYNSVAIELSFELDTQKCYGRIQLSNSNVIKYEMAEDDLTVAVNILGLSLTKLHFERNENEVSGYLYEYYGTEAHNIKTSALIKVDENYTTIISNKRETDDLNIEGYMEIYKNSTGNLVGAEVKETVKSIKYETSWFNIWNVTNINTIKVINETNGSNLDTIYINGSENPIKTKLVGGVSGRTLSRRFDIEMKDVFLYTYNQDEQKYEKVKITIPMLFVQNDFIDTFAEDFYEKNQSTGAINPTNIVMNSADATFMFGEYSTLIDEYIVIKEQVTYQSIIDYIGNKNEYFN